MASSSLGLLLRSLHSFRAPRAPWAAEPSEGPFPPPGPVAPAPLWATGVQAGGSSAPSLLLSTPGRHWPSPSLSACLLPAPGTGLLGLFSREWKLGLPVPATGLSGHLLGVVQSGPVPLVLSLPSDGAAHTSGGSKVAKLDESTATMQSAVTAAAASPHWWEAAAAVAPASCKGPPGPARVPTALVRVLLATANFSTISASPDDFLFVPLHGTQAAT